MEFIGALEKRGNYRVLRSEANGVKEEQQRAKFEKDPKTIKDIKKLKILTAYEGMPNNPIQRMADSHR